MKKTIHEKIDQIQTKQKEKEEDFVYGVNEQIKPGFLGKLENSLVERKKIKLKEKAHFFHLFGVLLNAGLNTIQSLNILKDKTPNQKFKRIISTISFDVTSGKSLSQSLEKFPDVFTKAEIGVIRSGEAIGGLDSMLEKLSKQTQDQNNLIMSLKSSLTYPIIVFIILIISTLLMFGLVIPKLVDLFTENSIEIPLITKIMMQISFVVQNFWGLIAIFAILITIISIAYFQTEEGKLNLDLYKLKIPLVGEIYKKVYIVRFVSTLGILLDAGVSLPKSLHIISDVVGNEIYKLKMEEIVTHVKDGEKISSNLEKTPFLFPETVSKMIEIGEKSATLSGMSEKIADQYLNEVEYSLKNITSIIGPLVIVVVGVFVAVFALGILSPVFKLSEGLI